MTKHRGFTIVLILTLTLLTVAVFAQSLQVETMATSLDNSIVQEHIVNAGDKAFGPQSGSQDTPMVNSLIASNAPSSPAADVDASCERYKDYFFGSPGRQSECQALVDLFEKTGGTGWTKKGGDPVTRGGWGSNDSYCFRYGVFCRGGFVPGDPTNQLMGLSLVDNNMVTDKSLGELGIPANFGDARGLQHLDLSNNLGLSGTLPISLTELNDLYRFHFDETNLCAPTEPQEVADVFEAWLSGIPNLHRNECFDYELIGLEVTQAIQNWRNEVPLVANKPTYVRAHVQIPEGEEELKDVTARLIVERDGANTTRDPKARITILPEKYDGEGKKIQPDRKNLNHSFYFKIPANWLQSNVTFEFKGKDDATKIDCKDIDKDCKITVIFEQVPAPLINFYLVSWFDQQGDPHVTGDEAYRETTENVEAMMPIPFLPRLPYRRLEIPLHGFPDLSDVLKTLRKLRSLNECVLGPLLCTSHVYHGVLVGFSPFAGSRGLASIFFAESAAYFKPGGSASEVPTTSSHELGHNFGRKHAPTDPNCADTGLLTTDYFYPYSDAHISEYNEGDRAFYGFDGFNEKIYSPTTTDLMGYCIPRWISDYTYTGIKDEIEVRFSSPGLSHSAASIQAAEEIVLVSGVITPTENSGSLDPVINAQSQGSIALPTPGSYTIRFLDLAGQELIAYSFEPGELSDGDNQIFSLLLPRHANATRIVLLRNDQELAIT